VEISEVFDAVTGFVALAALVAIVLLLPLYISQRRDVQRLREWMAREPGHPPADLAASEALLDRAESELERLLPSEPTPEPAPTPSTPMPAAERVTHERPALERITQERAALAPHPRWRRLRDRVARPRVLVAIGLFALLIGGAAIVLSEELLSTGDGSSARGGRGSAIDRSDVTVAVLNGTSVNGLAGRVGSDVESNGYQLGAVSSTTPGVEESIALYARGERAEAEKVARDLGIGPVQRLDRETARLAGDADVVVIAGEDRARP
jgi:LytR cell envelope-related transcriptional attenuator